VDEPLLGPAGLQQAGPRLGVVNGRHGFTPSMAMRLGATGRPLGC
jgi:hypothetical protein